LPADPAPRALARATRDACGLCSAAPHLPMNMWRPVMPRQLTADVESNVRRIEAI